MAASPWTQADPPLSRWSRQGSTPSAFESERWNRQRSTPLAFENGDLNLRRQHALSFEGAGRFWKPTEPKESSWPRFLKRKGDRSRALSSPRPQDELPSPVANVGEWLSSQSVSEHSEPSVPAYHDNSLTQPDIPSPEAQADTEAVRCASMSQHGSDSVSVHTVSSRTSISNMASQTRFQSLSEQIAEDDRKLRTKQNLKRIMEAEEARTAQLDPASTTNHEEELGSNNVYLKDREHLNGLRLTFELQNESWNIDDFLPGGNPDSADNLPDCNASNELRQASINLGQGLEKSTENSSIHTITVTDGKHQSEPFPPMPPISQVQELGVNDAALSRYQQTKSLPQIPQIQELDVYHVPVNKEQGVENSALSKPLKSERISGVVKMPEEIDKEILNLSELETKGSSPLGVRSSIHSRPQSEVSHASVSSISPTSTPPQETPPFSSVPGTLFQDLNRLKMSSSLRQAAIARPPRPPETRARSAPIRSSHSAPASSLLPSPPAVFPTYSPPGSQPALSGPIFKEVLTPPIPSDVIELSTSPSVIHRPKGQQVNEKYRRNRLHSDLAVYNTLPHEPYPLLPPGPVFEAPPSEEDLQNIQRAGTPRRSMIVPHQPPNDAPPRPVSIEPEIDPRTGFRYVGRRP